MIKYYISFSLTAQELPLGENTFLVCAEILVSPISCLASDVNKP